MDVNAIVVPAVTVLMMIGVIVAIIMVAYLAYRKKAREQKNYERGLKMVPIMIHLPPPSDDVDKGSRDIRDIADETISQSQTMYNVIASTVTKGFKSRIYGQRHMSFEIVANDNLIHYYAVVPVVLLENVKQAILAAYPTARLEEVDEINLFSRAGKISGTLGGEFTLTKDYAFPIETYKDTKRDAMGAILNALSMAHSGDGIGIQILLRPANDGWTKSIEKRVSDIKDGKKGANGSGGSGVDWSYFGQIFEALWKPPTASDPEKPKDPISGADQAKVEAMEEKAKHAGYEVLIRLVVSTPNSARSQALLTGLVSAFSIFNSPTNNGFKFTETKNIQEFVTSYIMRFFPQEINSNILNTVELATIFHLPNQTNIPSSQVERQKMKEVDGPSQAMPDGLLLGYNTFRGVKKPIRLADDDRRRHIYVMGSTGMGKSVFLENLALQDMASGKGFAFVDPHGDSAEKLLSMVPKERVEDVVYFNPSDMDNPIGMNLFEIDPNDPDPEHTQDYIIAETMNMLYSLYDPQRQGIVGPRMANIVRNAALLLMADKEHPGTFMDIPKILVDPDFAKPKIKYLKNQRAIDFWTKEWPNSQRSNDAGEVTSWVVSKWADFENTMMTNILGQTKSSLNIREIMDNQKILLVNLSKGKLGELPAKLLGMIFVMKFQAAAMSRANMAEKDRKDFCLFVDEFQNFATDSFESILSEARKYRLNLVVANQFMSQLIDKIKQAVLGNVGTYIIGPVGTEDVEEMVKMFQPVFSAEDLLYMPNYTAAVKMMIKGVRVSPFTMHLPPPMGFANKQLGDALRKLSAAKYGRPRAVVEAEIKQRQAATAPAEKKKPKPVVTKAKAAEKKGDSFLDNWLAKRKNMMNGGQISARPAVAATAPAVAPKPELRAPMNTPISSQNGSGMQGTVLSQPMPPTSSMSPQFNQLNQPPMPRPQPNAQPAGLYAQPYNQPHTQPGANYGSAQPLPNMQTYGQTYGQPNQPASRPMMPARQPVQMMNQYGQMSPMSPMSPQSMPQQPNYQQSMSMPYNYNPGNPGSMPVGAGGVPAGYQPINRQPVQQQSANTFTVNLH